MTSDGRLRWQCRRGMKELDAMLTGYLEGGLERSERASFQRLLENSDDQLWTWLMGLAAPQDEAMDGLVRKIRLSRPSR